MRKKRHAVRTKVFATAIAIFAAPSASAHADLNTVAQPEGEPLRVLDIVEEEVTDYKQAGMAVFVVEDADANGFVARVENGSVELDEALPTLIDPRGERTRLTESVMLSNGVAIPINYDVVGDRIVARYASTLDPALAAPLLTGTRTAAGCASAVLGAAALP